MSDCPSRHQLQQLLANELESSVEELLSSHVESCAACQEILDCILDPAYFSLAGWQRPETPTAEYAFLEQLGRSTLESFRPSALPWKSGAREGLRLAEMPQEIQGYEILEELGRGGMGVVYKARQRKLNRITALKIFSGSVATTAERVRFYTEVEAIAQLQHPNIVQVFEVSDHQGRPYYSLEFAQGGSLAQALRGQPHPPREAAELLAPLAGAIDHAHQHGIIHRDLKPANILLQCAPNSEAPDVDGSMPISAFIPKIADFGLAHRQGDLRQTHAGQIVGTPCYMAPEQVDGGRQPVSGCTDVYALGVILYEMLTGRPPFQGSSILSTLEQVRKHVPVPPSSLQPRLPKDLETICLKCLEKEPAHRYASAAELAHDLRRFLANQPILARPPSLVYQTRMLIRRNKALVGGTVGIVLALLVGTIVSTLFAFGEARERRIAEGSREEALAETYQARMMAALAALNEHDSPQARRHLEAAPAPFRRWEWFHLRSRLDESSRQLQRAGAEIQLVYYAAGWRGLLVTSAGAELWDLQTDQRLAIVSREPRTQVLGLPVQGGFRFLVNPEEGALQLVDETGRVLKQFEQLELGGHLKAAALSPDGRRLAIPSRSESFFAVVLDVETGRQVTAQLRGSSPVSALTFSPESDRLLVGGAAGGLSVWEIATSKQLTTANQSMAHTSMIRSICFSPDGSRFVSASDDQSFRQWDAKTYRLLDVRHPGSAVAMATYSPDGRWLATATRDHALMLWSVEGGEAAGAWLGHESDIARLAYKPDGLELASVGHDGVRFWELPGGGGPGVLRGHTSYVYAVACSSDGKWIASAGWDHVIRMWDARSGEQITALVGHKDWIASLAFSPDGRRLVSRSKDASIRTWDVATGQCLASWKNAGLTTSGGVHNVAVSPDGQLLAAAVENRVRFWDMATYQEKPPLTLPFPFLRVVAFSPDGRRLAIAGSHSTLTGPGVICLVRLETGQVEATFEAHHTRIHGLAFSPDGRWLVSTSSDRNARIWDVVTGQLVRQLDGHFDEVFAAAFHPDGRRLATAGRDRIIRLWDPETGEQVSQMRGHTDYVFSLAFSADGSTLVSGSGDFTVRLWDTFPAAQRYQARESLRKVRPQAEKLVDGLMQELGDPVAVAKKLQTDPPHGEWLLRAAEQALLQHSTEKPRH
jgi:WD40 repeat protein